MWTDELRQPAAPIWEAIYVHPYIQGMADGSLPEASFRYFVGQDAAYLKDFSRVLAMLAVKSPLRHHERIWLHHAETVHAVEQELHRGLAPTLGLDAETLAETAPGPVTTAYSDHLIRTAYDRPYAVLIAAVLPCYWIYREVGRRLQDHHPDFPPFRAWIDTYAGEAYGASVAEALRMADEASEGIGALDHQAAVRAFYASSRYEWLFWEQAWSQEKSLKAALWPAIP